MPYLGVITISNLFARCRFALNDGLPVVLDLATKSAARARDEATMKKNVLNRIRVRASFVFSAAFEKIIFVGEQRNRLIYS